MLNQKIILIWLFVTIAQLGATEARAQWVLTNFSGSVAFAASGSDLFAALPEFGVFLSTDNGDSWSRIDDGYQGAPIAANATGLFAAGEYGGVFHTSNKGMSWTLVNNGLPHGLYDTGYPGIYALALWDSNIFAGTDGNGVWLSTDKGANWVPANHGLTDTTVFAFTVSGTNLFALANDYTYDDIFDAGNSGSIYRSSDNGASWIAPLSGVYQFMAVSLASLGSDLFAGTNGAGVYLSSDSGSSWRTVNSGFPRHTQTNCFAVIGTDLFAGTDSNGIYLSTDRGSSWNSVNTGLTDSNVSALTVSGGYLVAGIEDGVWRRPLSDFGISSVAQMPATAPEIQSYPNPFSQRATISFTCESPGYADVRIMNLLGAEVARIYSGELPAGKHSFAWDAGGFAPGMYETVVRVGSQVFAAPIVLE